MNGDAKRSPSCNLWRTNNLASVLNHLPKS